MKAVTSLFSLLRDCKEVNLNFQAEIIQMCSATMTETVYGLIPLILIYPIFLLLGKSEDILFRQKENPLEIEISRKVDTRQDSTTTMDGFISRIY